MRSDILAAATSLTGVLLGGGLTYVAQLLSHRAADRADVRRHEVALAEARRAELVDCLERFLTWAQDAERVGIARHQDGLSGQDLRQRGDAAMDRVWIGEKLIKTLASSKVHEAALSYAWGLDDVIYRNHDPDDVWAYWLPRRDAFLAATRADLEALDSRRRFASGSP